MPTCYKLTTQEMTTYNNCKWTLGEWKKTTGEGELCGPGWLHAYSDPLVAVFMNPVHARIINPRLFLCAAGGSYRNDQGLKCGYSKLCLVKEIALPKFDLDELVYASILLAVEAGVGDPAWLTWACYWVNGQDRSKEAARSAAEAAARSAARSATWSAAEAAAWSAEAAARSAEAAEAAEAEAAARSAWEAAWEAAEAAAARSAEADNFNLLSILREVKCIST